MPAHDSSHHGWRIIITHNAGSRQFTPRVENNINNAGSRQLTPRVENNINTMPAHGSSHHGWRIIDRQGRLTAAHTMSYTLTSPVLQPNSGDNTPVIVPDMDALDKLARLNLKHTGLLQCGWLQASHSGKILQKEQLSSCYDFL